MGQIFHRKIADGVFQISSDSVGTSMEFGAPSANSYLIIGDETALLFDLALPEAGLKEYAEALAEKPVQVLISHGHPDHIYHMEDFDRVMLHKADKAFPLCDSVSRIPELCFVNDGDVIDAGKRPMEVFHLPGHTWGSVMLYDRKSKILFSGDTVARRLLYGLTGAPPLKCFCNGLRSVRSMEMTEIYSAHDRHAISPDYIDIMIYHIENDLPKAEKTWEFAGLPKMRNLIIGEETSAGFFDAAVPEGEIYD